MNFLLKDIGNNHHQTGIDKIINKVMKQIININRILVDFQIKEDQILENKENKEVISKGICILLIHDIISKKI